MTRKKAKRKARPRSRDEPATIAIVAPTGELVPLTDPTPGLKKRLKRRAAAKREPRRT